VGVVETCAPLWCVRIFPGYVQLSYGKKVMDLFKEVFYLYKEVIDLFKLVVLRARSRCRTCWRRATLADRPLDLSLLPSLQRRRSWRST
jgi:hypothetical protein